jgi:hypothetical protein
MVETRTDTAEKIDIIYRKMLMTKSPVERLKMAGSMLMTAKRLAVNGIREQFGELGEAELRVQLFLRFYGHEFSEKKRAKIIESIISEE